MGVTRSNSGLFSTPGFVVSPVGKRERGAGEEEREKKRRDVTKIKTKNYIKEGRKKE